MFGLMMLIISSIDSIRNIPMIALFGDHIAMFCLLAAALFLVPVGLVAAELAACWPTNGGVYQWVHYAFGHRWAWLAIWLQWINTMVWFPTILSFIAGTFAYLVDPSLASNHYFIVGFVLVLFWLLTLLALQGIHHASLWVSAATTIGLLLPMSLLIIIGAIHWHTTPITTHPWTWPHHDQWLALTAVMASYLGIELCGVYVSDLKRPQVEFPRALLSAIVVIITTMILSSSAVAMIVPSEELSLLTGVLQTFDYVLSNHHLLPWVSIISVMMLCGVTGGLVNWVIAPAHGLAQAASDGLIPPCFAAYNKNDVPHYVLLLQAGVVSVVSLLFVCIPSVNSVYWLLTNVSTQLYMMMYILLLLTAVVLRHRYPERSRPFRIGAQGHGLLHLVVGLGITGCICSIIAGFVPPERLPIGSPWEYTTGFMLLILVLLLPAWIVDQITERKCRQHEQLSQ